MQTTDPLPKVRSQARNSRSSGGRGMTVIDNCELHATKVVCMYVQSLDTILHEVRYFFNLPQRHQNPFTTAHPARVNRRR